MEEKPDLIELVEKKLKSGYPGGELKLDLLQQGYTEPEIDAAMASQSLQTKPNVFRISGWLVGGIFMFVSGVLVVNAGNNNGYYLMALSFISTVVKFLFAEKKD